MASITLFDSSVSGPYAGDNVGLLFEIAPDNRALSSLRRIMPLSSLIGDFEETKQKAYDFSRRLLSGEPELRGVRQLEVFEENVIREAQRAFHLLHLHDVLLQSGFDECVCVGSLGFGDALRTVAAISGSKLRVVDRNASAITKTTSIGRSWQRLRKSGLAPIAWRREWQTLLRRIDPFHRRHRLRPAGHKYVREQVWFYTTARTYTNIGLLYEPYFPEKLQFLIENPLTGGAPLAEAGRPSASIYKFARSKDIPSIAETKEARGIIRRHIERVSMDARGNLARQLFLKSTFFSEFLTRHLLQGLFFSATFERWLDIVRPSAVVVGNPAFEGIVLALAKRRGIPTLVLQHGILGDYAQFRDTQVGCYVVRGSFWKRFLAERVQPRAKILNPPQTGRRQDQDAGSHEAITFFTAPYFSEYWNEVDLDEILRVLLRVASEKNMELIIRVHPLETVDEYTRRVSLLRTEKDAALKVTFSQGAGLAALLARSAVAVMYSSTVFLDCLPRKIPVVSFGWNHFSYKRQIEPYGVFHFARDLGQLKLLLERASEGRLPAAECADEFLMPTSEEELKEELSKEICRPCAATG